jgi:LacI family transcriptional regulator
MFDRLKGYKEALAAMQGLKLAGLKMPEQIATVGFNNDPVSTVIEPNLTAVNYLGYQVGEVAAQNLINHLTGASIIEITTRMILRSDLVIRTWLLRSRSN